MSKDPKRQLQGKISRARGLRFEEKISEALDYYSYTGFAAIDKTPEPMKVLRRLENSRFIACFQKKAQPDYKGCIKGGREILFEAKYTDSDRILQERVGDEQTKYMNRHEKLGARCFVICGFASGEVYKVPWECWRNMKERFGHKYVSEQDLQPFRVPTAWNGKLVLLD